MRAAGWWRAYHIPHTCTKRPGAVSGFLWARDKVNCTTSPWTGKAMAESTTPTEERTMMAHHLRAYRRFGRNGYLDHPFHRLLPTVRRSTVDWVISPPFVGRTNDASAPISAPNPYLTEATTHCSLGGSTEIIHAGAIVLGSLAPWDPGPTRSIGGQGDGC